jgi:uncharacterized membrane protein
MPPFLIAYVASAVTLLALDAIWLTLATPAIYRPQLGDLLSDQPNLLIAGVFYLVYVIGLVVFVVLPAVEARSWLNALGLGALLGLVAYGTYDFTNLATIRNWPVSVAIIDVCWGMFVSAAAALAGYFVVRWLTAG